MFQSRFLEISILQRQQSADWNKGDEVVLDYKRYETKTVKFLVDAIYTCNADPPPLDQLVKLLQLLSKFGFTETVEGKTEYPCTSKELEYI